jgi:predicted RNA-binding Zn ribbon-like protein
VAGTTITTRLPANAALFAPAPPHTGRRGRPAKKGQRLPRPVELGATATWHTVTTHRYGRLDTAEVAVIDALWSSRLVDRLVGARLVERIAAAGDRRTVTLSLTEPGQRAAAEVADIEEALFRTLEQAITKTGVRHINNALAGLVAQSPAGQALQRRIDAQSRNAGGKALRD